jgi:DNA invertase Pin-like site-specific DNA recombinase
MERPALHRLLADIEAGQIDVVVIYKLDRLTRNLADFSGLMAGFDLHRVALVSVTQHLNTRDAAGRLAINTLMSFAQFERELIGERLRDKIAATRRKGLWIGSIPPLGYELRGQHLVINQKEARVVRRIFQRFVVLGSVTTLARELIARGVTTKAWLTKSGKARGGQSIDKNYLYKLLNNRMFLGELHYDDGWHPGIHTPIISAALWDRAHALLHERRRPRKRQAHKSDDFILKGLVFGVDGRAYSPWASSVRHGRCYRYYVPQRNIVVGAGASGLPRFSAYQLESVVIDHLRDQLRAPSSLILGIPLELNQTTASREEIITSVLTKIDSAWDLLFPALQKSLVRALLNSVIIGPDKLEIRIDTDGLSRIVQEVVSGESSA